MRHSRSQVTARRVRDGQTVCRDARQFKLTNAVINNTDEREKSEEIQTPQAVPDLEIQQRGTPPSVTPVPPNTTGSAEKLKEPRGAEIIPEQGAEHNQPVDKPAVMRPRRERCQPSYLKDYVLVKQLI